MKTENIIQKKAFVFSLNIIKFYKILIAEKEYILSKQLLRSGTSIGANIEEALAGQSRKDFTHKMSIASKEARETRYWLNLLKESNLVDAECSNLLIDIEEIIKILTKIVISCSKKKNTYLI